MYFKSFFKLLKCNIKIRYNTVLGILLMINVTQIVSLLNKVIKSYYIKYFILNFKYYNYLEAYDILDFKLRFKGFFFAIFYNNNYKNKNNYNNEL